MHVCQGFSTFFLKKEKKNAEHVKSMISKVSCYCLQLVSLSPSCFVTVQHSPVMQETWVPSLSQEDPLEKEMATPVFLPGKSHGQRSLVGYSP